MSGLSQSAAALEEQGVSPRSDLPVWVPRLEWWATLPAERRAKLRSGLTPEREAEVLAAWHARVSKAG